MENNNLEKDNLEKDLENNKNEKQTKPISISNILKKLFNDFKTGVVKNYKVLILISFVFAILLCLKSSSCLDKVNNFSNKSIKQIIGGANENNGLMNNNTSKKKGKTIFSGGLGIMYSIAKNILLFYLLLIFITAIPSVPIILYITVLYFIMTGMFSKLNDI
jgi:hypothetical protein